MSQPLARPSPRRIAALVFVLGSQALGVFPARADGDPDLGAFLASRWCDSCHLVEGAVSASDAAPSFQSIARKHGKDQAWLRAWLSSPHPPMPNLNMSRQEIDAIIAYLATLPQQ